MTSSAMAERRRSASPSSWALTKRTMASMAASRSVRPSALGILDVRSCSSAGFELDTGYENSASRSPKLASMGEDEESPRLDCFHRSVEGTSPPFQSFQKQHRIPSEPPS